MVSCQNFILHLDFFHDSFSFILILSLALLIATTKFEIEHQLHAKWTLEIKYGVEWGEVVTFSQLSLDKVSK